MTELTIADIDKTIIMTKNRLTDALNKNVSAGRCREYSKN